MDLRYEGDTVVQELVGGTISRTYASDDTGRIVQVCDPDCAAGTIYVVVYNGHGDATGLWRKNADGTLTLANSYTYTTWGAPTTMAAGGFGDLKFRFLYVGASDVQWDSSFGLNLHYMHSRHYSPTLGRFIQPDPSGVDSNLYAYAEDDPITRSDPKGLWCEDHAYICGAARAGWKWARGFVRNVVRWGLGGDISRLSRFSRFATHEVRTVLPRISSHAWKRLAERGVTVRQAEAAVRYGTCFWDPKNLSVFYIIQMASGKYIGVAESVHTWIIKTVEYGTYKELRRPRMILGGYGCNQSPYR